MNDLDLSLYLDGRLPEEEKARLERRLEAEPDLRAQLEALRRLQEVSASLPFERGRFEADDVRVALGRSGPSRVRWVVAAAAVLVLALTHLGAYVLGGRGTEAQAAAEPDPILEAERLLARASLLDEGAPHGVLRHELGDLRRDIHMASLPSRLAGYEDGEKGRRRAAQLADTLAQVELVLDHFQDPGFRVLVVKGIAVSSLTGEPGARILPATASSYTRITPLPEKRFLIYVVDTAVGRVVSDEGTVEELRERHPHVRFIEGD